jgi:hypothetical protein
MEGWESVEIIRWDETVSRIYTHTFTQHIYSNAHQKALTRTVQDPDGAKVIKDLVTPHSSWLLILLWWGIGFVVAWDSFCIEGRTKSRTRVFCGTKRCIGFRRKGPNYRRCRATAAIYSHIYRVTIHLHLPYFGRLPLIGEPTPPRGPTRQTNAEKSESFGM